MATVVELASEAVRALIDSYTAQVKYLITPVYNVKGFGAKSDGVTDDTTAINAALNAASDTDIVYIPPGTYKISDTINVKCNLCAVGAKFICDNALAPAVQVGDNFANLANKFIILPQVIRTSRVWEGDIGVKCVNLINCKVNIPWVSNFEVGLLVTALNGKGNVYNDYFLGTLWDNKVNLKIQPGDGTSWTNENNFFGGRHSHSSSLGNNVPGTRQIEILPYDVNSTSSWPNNNVFYKPCVEGNVPEYHIVIGGGYNTFINPRMEATTPKVLLQSHPSSNQCSGNIILGGYNSQNITFTTSGSIGYNSVMTGVMNWLRGTGAVLNLENTSSSSYPVIQVFDPVAGVINKGLASTDWNFRLSADHIQCKNRTDAYERIKINFYDGCIYFGDGSAAPTKYITNSATGIKAFGGNMETDGGGYNTPHLVLGTYHIWVDSSGKLRIKNGAPTSDTDGVIVGTQS